MAFVTGNQHQRALDGHGSDAAENLMIDRYPVEHGSNDPSHEGRSDFYKSRLIVGGDFFQVSIGLAVNLLNRNFAVFGMRFHKLPQTIPG